MDLNLILPILTSLIIGGFSVWVARIGGADKATVKSVETLKKELDDCKETNKNTLEELRKELESIKTENTSLMKRNILLMEKALGLG